MHADALHMFVQSKIVQCYRTGGFPKEKREEHTAL